MAETNPRQSAAAHEADPADVAEQQASVSDDTEASARAEVEQIRRRPSEAPEADVAEQAVEVVGDEDEWR